MTKKQPIDLSETIGSTAEEARIQDLVKSLQSGAVAFSLVDGYVHVQVPVENILRPRYTVQEFNQAAEAAKDLSELTQASIDQVKEILK